MKPIVTVLKQDLEKHPELLFPLSDLCDHVEQDVDSYAFFPKTKASMNLICLLLDKEIVYKLGFESSPAERNHTGMNSDAEDSD